jgi:4-nitrophenyl phosphatase
LKLEQLKPTIRGLILDVDGVLWRDSQPIGDLRANFAEIARRQLKVSIATNNAMKSVDEYLAQFRSLGVTIEPSHIVTSADATADVLRRDLPKGSALFAIGEHGLFQALEDRGFATVGDPAANQPFAAVVVGLDRSFSYSKLHKAAALVRAGAPFYGTNSDATFPTAEGLVPGAGAVLAAIASASGKQPLVVGKPSPLLFETAAERIGLSAAELLVVGDRLETDIAGGQAFGARTALVLSGVSNAEQAHAWHPSPTLIELSLATLLGV